MIVGSIFPSFPPCRTYLNATRHTLLCGCCCSIVAVFVCRALRLRGLPRVRARADPPALSPTARVVVSAHRHTRTMCGRGTNAGATIPLSPFVVVAPRLLWQQRGYCQPARLSASVETIERARVGARALAQASAPGGHRPCWPSCFGKCTHARGWLDSARCASNNVRGETGRWHLPWWARGQKQVQLYRWWVLVVGRKR